MDLNPDWREFLESFESNGVEYLIVGALAVAFHGRPRLTGDMDVWVRPTPENARRVLKAVQEFGFEELGLTETDLTGPDTVIQIGYPPRRIDVLTFLTGLDFESAWNGRVAADLGGVKANVLGLEDLTRNKTATARPRDLADVESLQRPTET